MVRLLNKVKRKDQVNTEILLTQVNMLSVNRINAQVKFLEVWKALNLSKNPLNIELPIQEVGNGVLSC